MLLNHKEFTDYKAGDAILYRAYDPSRIPLWVGQESCDICVGEFVSCEASTLIVVLDDGEKIECHLQGFYATGEYDTQRIVVFSDDIGYSQYIDQMIMDIAEHMKGGMI